MGQPAPVLTRKCQTPGTVATRESILNSFLTGSEKFSVMTETLLYAPGSCERHSEFTEEMYIPLRPTPKEDTLHHWCFYKLGNWQKLADQSTWYLEGNSAEFTSSEKVLSHQQDLTGDSGIRSPYPPLLMMTPYYSATEVVFPNTHMKKMRRSENMFDDRQEKTLAKLDTILNQLKWLNWLNSEWNDAVQILSLCTSYVHGTPPALRLGCFQGVSRLQLRA